ncbi:MAG: 30S ribosomal protein S6 [Turneriella sp.]|nr:30S ribosomal protein S6 [Turneriella sp.]
MAKRNYELVLVLTDKSGEEKNRARAEVEAALEKRGAEITARDDWGARKLYHRAKKQDRGHFYYYSFRSDGQTIAQINNDLRVNAGVLKAMITATD